MYLTYRIQRFWKRYDPKYYLTVTVSVLCVLWYFSSGSGASPAGNNDLPHHKTLDRYSASILEEYARNPSLTNVPFKWEQVLETDKWFLKHKEATSSLSCAGLKERIQKPDSVRFNCEDDAENTLYPITLRENVLFYMTEFYRQLFGKDFLAKVWPNPSRLVYLFPDRTVELSVDPNPRDTKFISENLLKAAKKVSLFERIPKTYVPKQLTYNDFHYQNLFPTYSENSEVTRLHNKYPDLRRARKYFQEGYDFDHQGHQYVDWRFYNSSIIFEDQSYALRIKLYHRIIRAWLHFAAVHDVDTWISHHAMVGWYHTGLHAPFDKILDFQITMKSLLNLVDSNYNNTVIFDYSDLDSGIKGEYLLDIGPYFKLRDRNNRENQVDIRLIDLNSGLFLDIYALASFSYELLYKFKAKPLLQSYSEDDIPRIDALIQKYASNKENLLFDRALRIYEFQDLEKLVPVKFENEVAYVPLNYDKILRSWTVNPYADSHQGYKLRPGINMWLSTETCKLKPFENDPNPKDSLECLKTDPLEAFFYERTKKVTQEHVKFMETNNKLQPPPEPMQLTVADNGALY